MKRSILVAFALVGLGLVGCEPPESETHNAPLYVTPYSNDEVNDAVLNNDPVPANPGFYYVPSESEVKRSRQMAEDANRFNDEYRQANPEAPNTEFRSAW